MPLKSWSQIRPGSCSMLNELHITRTKPFTSSYTGRTSTSKDVRASYSLRSMDARSLYYPEHLYPLGKVEGLTSGMVELVGDLTSWVLACSGSISALCADAEAY